MCAGWLAICGIPIWAGFFSKDEILWKTWSASSPGIPPGLNKALWFIGAVTALLTAIYMTRLMVMTFWGVSAFVMNPMLMNTSTITPHRNRMNHRCQ